MKKISLIILFVIGNLVNAQEGLHYQFHKSALALPYYQHNVDTVYKLLGVPLSTLNVIGVYNLTNESWSYIKPTGLALNLVSNQPIVMKDLNNGIVMQTGMQGSVTSTNWQTTSTQTLPAITKIEGATKFGYYAYSTNTATFNTLFSVNGSVWNTVHSGTTLPVFSKTKTKLYTIYNNLLNASTNGGASFSSVNATYTLSGIPVTPNDDTLFVVSNQLYRSFDGGVNWSTVSIPSTVVSQVAAKNGAEIMYLDETTIPKKVYYTNNSGTSWTTYTTLPSGFSGEKLITNGKNFYLFPNYKSSNGATWNSFLGDAPAPKPYDISFTGSLGLVGMEQGYFGYTTNKGFNYTFQPNKIPSNLDAMAVKAIDINTFLVADRKGQIYLSNNQGATWINKTSSTINNIPRKFSVSNDKNTIVLSCIGASYVSFNAGSTFSFLNVSSGNGHYQAIKPVSGKIVDVVPLLSTTTFTQTGFEFYEFNTSNVRTLTSTVSVSAPQDIVDVQMANDNVGYLMTRNPSNNETIVYKTTNGWITTNTISSIPTPTAGIRTYDARYGNIQCFGTDTIIISGSGNPVNNQTNFYHISTNGGVSWSIVYTAFTHPVGVLGNKVYKMVFFNSSEFVSLISSNICGSAQSSQGVYINVNANGQSSGGVGISELFVNDTHEDKLKVYPNPTNDNITIELPASNIMKRINISNLLGQVVFSEEIIGNGNLILNISSLESGVYLVNVSGEGFVKNAKVVKR